MTKFCRICFSANIRLLIVVNTNFQKMLKKIAAAAMIGSEDSLVHVCYLCAAALKKWGDFADKCLRSHSLLKELLNGLEQLPNDIQVQLKPYIQPQTLTVSKVTHIDIIGNNDYDVPIIKAELVNKIKTEDVDIVAASPLFLDHVTESFNQSSESEDDNLPLQEVLKKKTKDYKKQRKNEHNKVKREYEKVSVRADVINLSVEEQLAEVKARSNSSNYLNSPYKCQLCFKGFVDPRAIEIHMRKHEESQGALSCDICHLRYTHTRQLRVHTLHSHSRKYRCRLCEHISHTFNQAKEHDNWHEGYMFECQLCGSKFNKSSSYLTHARKAHPRAHSCLHCGERFLSQHGLLMHSNKTHRFEKLGSGIETDKELKSKCDVCGLEIKSELLQDHLLTHEKKERVKCTECGDSFKNDKILRCHVKRIHLGIKYSKNIICEACGKTFSSAASLKLHQRTHSGERPHACTVCNKRFTHAWALRVHARVHSGERPYECGLCGRKFAQAAPLRRHYRTHTGAKPYTCHLCTKSFSQSNSLKLHVTTVHLKMPSKYKKNKAQNQADVLKPKEENSVNEYKLNNKK